jgi:hypothetical protein
MDAGLRKAQAFLAEAPELASGSMAGGLESSLGRYYYKHLPQAEPPYPSSGDGSAIALAWGPQRRVGRESLEDVKEIVTARKSSFERLPSLHSSALLVSTASLSKLRTEITVFLLRNDCRVRKLRSRP